MAALARNPLMLTFMARLAEASDEIPTRRVELYDQVLRGLLSVWPREGERDLERMPPIQPGSQLDGHLRLLAAVSHRLVDAGRLNEVSESDLCAVVERSRGELFGPHHQLLQCDAASLLAQWKADGLLVPIGGGEVLFLHGTFQEYLAGMALVPHMLVQMSGPSPERDAGVERCAAAIAERMGGEDAARAVWEEPIRLGLGYLGVVKGQAAACEAVVRGVVERAPGPPGRAVAAMGEAVAEISSNPVECGRAAGREGVTPGFRAAVVETVRACMRDEPIRDRGIGVEVIQRLMASLEGGEPASRSTQRLPSLIRRLKRAESRPRERPIVAGSERVACGNALARLGDPRCNGPDRWCLPDDLEYGKKKERFGFIRIEKGKFVMGEDQGYDSRVAEDEGPRHTVTLDYVLQRLRDLGVDVEVRNAA